MPTILVLGATGLLGHQLVRALAPGCSVVGTSHQSRREVAFADETSNIQWLDHVSALDHDRVRAVLETVRPNIAINCIGIVKSRISETAVDVVAHVNQLFPLWLADQCEARGIRLIHISTDCVYSGKRGRYSEADFPDPVDLYGQTKFLGEPQTPHSLVLRTSFIGYERGNRRGLLEWLRSHRNGRVQGYSRALFSGLTTIVLAEAIRDLILGSPALSGIWHVAGPVIDKYHLLQMMNDTLGLGITIDLNPTVACDRSLDGSRFCAATGFRPPSWEEMLSRLAQEPEC